MRIVPNIGKPHRAAYIAIGLLLALAPFVTAVGGWLQFALPALGAVSIVAGAVGW